MQIILTVGVIIFQNNTVLLVKHGNASGHINNVYGIPGGHIEEGESLPQAAARELKEETGLVAQEIDLTEFPHNEFTADIPRKDATTKRYTMHLFLAKQFSGNIKGTDETVPEWVIIEDLNHLHLLPNVKEAVFAAINFRV